MEATLTLWQRLVRVPNTTATIVARSGGYSAARLACSLLLALSLAGSLSAQDTGVRGTF